MKKLGIALLLAMVAPYASAGTCSVDASGGTTDSDCASGDLKGLSSGVSLQASSGVYLLASDEDETGVSTGQTGISTCHQNGSVYFYGNTDGGSVQKRDPGDSYSCSSTVNYNTASSG